MPFCILLPTGIKLFYIICKGCDSKCLKIIFSLHIGFMYQRLLMLCFLCKDVGYLELVGPVRLPAFCERRADDETGSRIILFQKLENSYPGKTNRLQ